KRRHLKLGRGSLSDVEWTVQLMQLEHGHELAGLRTTSTLGALEAATEAGLLSAEDSAQLAAAWTMATEVRSAVMLFRGRTAEALPVEHTELEATARLLGYAAGTGHDLKDDYLRTTRHARAVMEQRFYGFSAGRCCGRQSTQRSGRRALRPISRRIRVRASRSRSLRAARDGSSTARWRPHRFSARTPWPG